MLRTLLTSVFFCVSVASGFSQTSNVALDPRAARHYSATDIAQMTPMQIAEINFIYQNSFVINQDKPCAECPPVDFDKIDVSLMQRNPHTRARYYQTVPGHPIDLLSEDEVQAALIQIRQQFQNASN
jgi:hypothetical protein